jgi:HAE1 family hydrophobic/amphiphilic exporter-1
MRLPERAIRFPVTTIILFVTLAALGVISLRRVAREQFPDISYPTAAIFTSWPGVGPYEVESQVTKPIEEAVSTINGVDKVTSTSTDGVSLVIVNFTWGTDMTGVVSEIREAISSIESDLPEGAERARIVRFNPNVLPVFTFTVSTPTEGIDVRRLAEKEVLPAIQRLAGVASAELAGGRQVAAICRLDLDSLGRTGVPILAVVQAFTRENTSLPGGSIELADRELVLRTTGEFASLSDIGDVVVGSQGTIPVRLADVAEVALADLPRHALVRSGTASGPSAEAVSIDVQKMEGTNTVAVIDGVKAALADLRPRLPPSVEIGFRTDQSKSILESLSSLTGAAWQGGLLAVIVLVFFLRNLRSVLIIALSIPVSVIATFTLMYFARISLNIMSMAGLTLGVGMFVDNSIVVLEVIFRKQLAGMPPKEAAATGAGEVTMAVTASTITNIVVFLPLVFVTGLANLIMRDLAATLTFSMLMSLAMAMTLVPVLCVRFMRLAPGAVVRPPALHGGKVHLEISLADVELHTGNRLVDRLAGLAQAAIRRLDERYGRVLAWSIRRPWAVIAAALALMAASVAAILLVGMEFLPETDEGRFSIAVETRVDSPIAATEARVRRIEEIVRSVAGRDLAAITSVVGRSGGTGLGETGSHLARVSVSLVAKDRRARSIWRIIDALSGEVARSVTDVRATFSIEGLGTLVNLAAGDERPIVVEITGEDLARSRAYAARVAGAMQGIAGARDVDLSYKEGKPELEFRVKRREATSLGLSPLEIAATIRAAYDGVAVSRYRQGEDTWDVQVMLREEDRTSLDRVGKLFLVNPAGTRIPLENVVDITRGTGPVSIQRSNKARLIKVTAALTGARPLDRVTADVRAAVDSLGTPPPGVAAKVTGARGQMADTFSQLLLALALGAGLVYVVMASQFESLLHPLIVMFAIPFAAIGLVAALLLTGTTFSMVAFVGAILLVGYVVNNGILLIDYMRLLRANGLPLERAVAIGGRTRLKPILMSTGTTMLGLLPMALGLGTGAELRAPMARAVFGGLASSTLITLVLIPVIYYVVERVRERRTA